MTQLLEIRVPDIGDVTDVPVVELLVQVGDHLQREQTVAVLESDKASIDVPSPFAGRVHRLSIAVGDRVAAGSVLLMLEPAGEAPVTPEPSPAKPVPTQPAPPQLAAAPQPAMTVSAPPLVPSASGPGLAHASPAMRRYARTLGVQIANLTGTGPKGRITREDIEAHVKARMTAPATGSGGTLTTPGLPDWPKVDFAKFGPIERVALSRITRISGPSLARNAMVIPHVTNFDKADVTELETFRTTANAEADQPKLTMLAFAVKAVAATLQAFPRFNAALDGDELVLRHYRHIGVAADTPDGLVVPVIRDADRKSLRDIAAEMATLAATARAGKLKPADMQGATFTISSLGGVGGTGFTPIINAPEVAILGMTRAEIAPVWDGAAFQPRLIQPLSLSWDHRVTDGVAAARFLAHLAGLLGDFRRISL